MTNKEKKEWLSGKYPLTVIQDRYVGVYSGARWLAFPLDYTDVPEDANGDDTICAQFWHDYKEPVGKGGCAEEAIDNLLMEMEASIPKEIDEEKVRKFLLRLAKRCPEDSLDFIGEVKKADVLAYLEKQKEKKPTLDLPAGFYFIDKNGKKYYTDTLKCGNLKFIANQKEQKPVEVKDPFSNANFVRGYESGYADAKREQKPAEWKPTEEQFNYLAKAIITLGEEGDCKTAGVLSEIRKGLKCSFPDWKVSPDYPEEGCKVSLNGEVKKIQEWSEEDKKLIDDVINSLCCYQNTLSDYQKEIVGEEIRKLKSLKPQPKQEWSEEDEKMLGYLLAVIEDGIPTDTGKMEKIVAWLKSLRNGIFQNGNTHWKPSKEQMEALEYVIRDHLKNM